ncbi:glycosyltransferase family 2 protein [Paraglaciecola agarilytica]|uniref:glycosyltransferase family 2 protein n=1 Tax=Paraglaciecola chathamensis TaxID=368405 RepID=UPI001C094455|nr:glycosyltransferase family 2 protein [Paraglaciecola agarilytica]MBU3019374.1 glycosyltransferase family 2 protein [Paraglaciecola agarilytica]
MKLMRDMYLKCINPPKSVTVLIPTFNSEKFISAALDSIILQTYRPLEVIILDDASSDKTVDIIKDYQKENEFIKLYENEFNLGIIPSRNRLFELPNSDFLAVMDADDICHPERIEKQVMFLIQNPDISVVGSWYQFFGEKKGVVRLPTDDYSIKSTLFISNALCNPATLIRHSFLKKFKLRCNIEYAGAADYLFWIDCAQYGKLANIPQVLLDYRVHQKQESIHNNTRQRRAHLRIVTEQLNKLGVTYNDEAVLRAIIWPSASLDESLYYIGQGVKKLMDQVKSADSPVRSGVGSKIDIRFRSLCRIHGLRGLKVYLLTQGLIRLMQGRRFGIEFILSCYKNGKGLL